MPRVSGYDSAVRATKRPRGRPRHPDVLTPAEWRVANAVRHGMSNQEISRRLKVSADTVKYHVENILGKLSMERRSELRRWDGAPVDSALRRRGNAPAAEITLGAIGQISRQVSDIPGAVEWYTNVLGLPHLYTFGDLAFFDCGGTRLYLSRRGDDSAGGESILYFSTPDISAAYEQLVARGVTFRGAPHMIHRHPSGVEEWMAFFEDPDGHLLALMSQVTP
jgi:DNA-binding CsgD family transcriptional regulator/catechol 2,3-dioxygenase-like lactoylglutathione lyase family enzyme